MLQASWSDLSESVDRCFEAACFQPISIGNNGKPTHALLSIEEYARLKKRDRQVLRTSELPEWMIDQIEKSRVPPEFDHLDELLAGMPESDREWGPLEGETTLPLREASGHANPHAGLRIISRDEFAQDIDRHMEGARFQPLGIARGNGGPSHILLSIGQFLRLKKRDKLVIYTSETPDWLVEELENGNSEPPPELEYLDEGLEDIELGPPEGGMAHRIP